MILGLVSRNIRVNSDQFHYAELWQTFDVVTRVCSLTNFNFAQPRGDIN